MEPIARTDLILNPDGSIYHLHLLPEEIADTIILVGDPGRVDQVSSKFDTVEMRKANREFTTHTGSYRGKRMTVLSTGIGTDNIDIVMNELDALASIDLERRSFLPSPRRLTLIRIGTSGALHGDIEPGSVLLTEVAGGLDGLYHFYMDHKGVTIAGLTEAFVAHTRWDEALARPYFVRASERLIRLFHDPGIRAGITLSSPGFYAPQFRSLRLVPRENKQILQLSSFSFERLRIQNFEMESSALYALASLMGHEAVTLCVAIANRVSSRFLEDYKPAIDALVVRVLDKLAVDEGSGT